MIRYMAEKETTLSTEREVKTRSMATKATIRSRQDMDGTQSLVALGAIPSMFTMVAMSFG